MKTVQESIKRQIFKSPWATEALRQARVGLHFMARQPHEGDFLALAQPAFGTGLLLDLGANIGQSAISAHKVQPGLAVHSIEANPACEPGLKMTRRLLGAGFQYQLVGVGAQPGTLQFHVPVRASRMLLEEGTFDLGSLTSPASVARLGLLGCDYTLQAIPVPMVTVDSLGVSPRVIKLDLQGLELSALQGMAQTLVRCRPALMIEVGDHHDEVVALLAAWGYGRWHWNGAALRAGGRPDGLNEFFFSPCDPALLH